MQTHRATRAGCRALGTALRRTIQAGNFPALSTRGTLTSSLPRYSQRHNILLDYLERSGAAWGEEVQATAVAVSEDGRSFRWQVLLSDLQLQGLRHGVPVESELFELYKGSGHLARFAVYPKGDMDADDGFMSLYLLTDCKAVGSFRLRAGSFERNGGAQNFCEMKKALQGDVLEVEMVLESESTSPGTSPSGSSSGKEKSPKAMIVQSMQLDGLQSAEWRVCQAQDEIVSSEGSLLSTPFRFHHVLLGDMYLELVYGDPYPGCCVVYFRSRVPQMKLEVTLEAGENFSKTFISVGRSTQEDDLKNGHCLQVNLDAPGALEANGDLLVKAKLERVLYIPEPLKEKIPKLDERASWPKRL